MTAAEYVTPDPPEAVSALAFLHTVLGDLSDLLPAYLNDQNDTAATLLLNDIREQRKALASLEAFVEADLAGRLGNGKHAVPGFQVEVRGGSSFQNWRHDEVAWACTRDIAVDPDTGEINPDVVPIIDLVRSRLLNCARPNWRLTQLRNLGIDPNNYADWQAARRTVQLVPEAEAAS